VTDTSFFAWSTFVDEFHRGLIGLVVELAGVISCDDRRGVTDEALLYDGVIGLSSRLLRLAGRRLLSSFGRIGSRLVLGVCAGVCAGVSGSLENVREKELRTLRLLILDLKLGLAVGDNGYSSCRARIGLSKYTELAGDEAGVSLSML